MKEQSDERHDGGLQQDLAIITGRILGRRQVLTWLLAGGAAAIVGSCGGDGSSGSSGATASGSSNSSAGSGSSGSGSESCLADPEETEGPYPSDGSNTVNGMASNVLAESGVVRSDIRASFGTSSNVAPGVPCTLTLSLVDTNNLCTPLAGYAVYIWHCTRDGQYSLYSRDVQDENFLRGVQVADADGKVTFTTIFPGCYSGRYPHIHFEIYPGLELATLYTNKVLTSQLAMPEDIASEVYAGADGYDASAGNFAAVSLARDGIFGDNSDEENALMTPALSGNVVDGFVGTIVIGVPA